jgi:hypothetical protein
MRVWTWVASAVSATALVVTPIAAQVRTVDPNSAIDADLAPRSSTPSYPQSTPVPAEERVDPGSETVADPAPPPSSATPTGTADYPPPPSPDRVRTAEETYHREDLMTAAENVFGKGAAGLGGMLERILKEQGEPNAYIAGREASGAFVVGLRYGSGIMTHRVEGERKVFWTGPSLGFDVGGDANKVFVLVYNLYDTQELYNRFPAAEGRVFFVGGFAATYLRRGNTVLIPVRLGVGWRLGANVGYMKFSEKANWMPF